jgi:WD40 repeat protein
VKGAVLKDIAAHVDKTNPNPIYTVAFSPDGSKVLTSSYDRTLKLYDVASGNFIRELKAHDPKTSPNGHQDEVYAAAFSPDGKLIASGSGGQERVIKLWKADDGAFVRDLANPQLMKDPKGPAVSHPGWIYQVRFMRSGRLVSVGDAPKNGGYLAVWDPTDGKLIDGEATSFGALYGLALSADDKLLAVGAGSRSRVSGDFDHAYLLRVPGINK